MEAQPDFEISMTDQAKPFPLVVATFINSKSDGKAPITITSEPATVQCFDDKQPASTVKLVRSKEYLLQTLQHF
jgi:hypothetical protein